MPARGELSAGAMVIGLGLIWRLDLVRQKQSEFGTDVAPLTQ